MVSTIYLGRIPHGFYEDQLRSYFSQFGTLNHVRLSRNKRTGQSKHYAFLQFQEEDAARCAAEAMNNYLLDGKLLKCQVMQPEQVHEKMWNGADRKFKQIPWQKIHMDKYNARPVDVAKRAQRLAVKRQKAEAVFKAVEQAKKGNSAKAE
jgi:nucleolar protein 15